MNIWPLDPHPSVAASLVSDQDLHISLWHSAEVLAFEIKSRVPDPKLPEALFKRHNLHKSHPWIKWVCNDPNHFGWLLGYAQMLAYGYLRRFGEFDFLHPVVFSGMSRFDYNTGASTTVKSVDHFPLVMPEEGKLQFGYPEEGYCKSYTSLDGVKAYQSHYLNIRQGKKKAFTLRKVPYLRALEVGSISGMEEGTPFYKILNERE